MTRPYCVVGVARGTGLQIVRQLVERGVPVRCIARDPAKARNLLPAGVDFRQGDVTDPNSLRRARFGECCAMFSRWTSPAEWVAAASSSRKARSAP